MSQSFIDRSQQSNTSITPDETTQKKIDPVAQLKWLNSQNGDQGFGIYGDSQPAQMFTSDEEDQTQRKPEEELLQGKAKDEELQMKEKPTRVSSSTKSSIPEDVRGKMENSFGVDFSGVSIHQNSDQASNIGALAYTQGSDVHFAPGQYNPSSQKGQELLGHELTHVLQQRQGRVKSTKQGKGMPINDNPALEKEADVMGAKAAQGKMADVAGRGSGVQRKDDIDWIKIKDILSDKLGLWLNQQIDTIDRLYSTISDEDKIETTVVNPLNILGLILGAIPQTSKFKDIGIFMISLLTEKVNSLGEKPSFTKFYFNYINGLEAIRDGLIDDSVTDNLMPTIKANSIGLTQEEIGDNIISYIIEDLPNRNRTERNFLFGWIKIQQDWDDWAYNLLEADGKKGKRAGYLYLRAFKNVPGNTWSMVDGPHIDDLEKSEGTNKAIQRIYGENTSIFDLPYELKVSIEVVPPPGRQLMTPHWMNHFIGYRASNIDGELFSQTPVPEVLSGNIELFNELKTGKFCPKTKDLKND